MADYRLYYLNGPANRITEAKWIVAETDEEAICKAQRRRKSLKSELWLPHRRVAEFPAYRL
jgi:hypothetical protein